MEFDFRRIRLGERIAGVCAVLLFFDMFLHWYGIKGFSGTPFGPSFQFTAWRIFSYTDLLLLLLIVLAIAMVVLAATQRSVALPIGANVIVALFGALMTLLVLYRLINQPGPNELVTVKLFGYVGLLLTAGVAVGAFMSMRDEGMTLGDAAQRLQNATAAGGAPPPRSPAPPPTAAPGAPPPADAPPPAGSPGPAGEPPPPPPPPPPPGAATPPREPPPPGAAPPPREPPPPPPGSSPGPPGSAPPPGR